MAAPDFSAAYEGLISAVDAEGARRHSNWSSNAFRTFARVSGRPLSWNLRTSPDHDAVMRGFLDLAREAFACGYLPIEKSNARSASNLIEVLWTYHLPVSLHQVPAPSRLSALAEAWNLGEGLLTQPAWLNQVVASMSLRVNNLKQLPELVAQALEEFLSETRAATFAGPLSARVVDPSPFDEDFLPGEMHFAAPRVLCVHDRLRRAACLGVVLRTSSEARIIAASKCLGNANAVVKVSPDFEDQLVRVGDSRVALPGLRVTHRSVASPAGFLVANAVDSQRLWVVESP